MTSTLLPSSFAGPPTSAQFSQAERAAWDATRAADTSCPTPAQGGVDINLGQLVCGALKSDSIPQSLCRACGNQDAEIVAWNLLRLAVASSYDTTMQALVDTIVTCCDSALARAGRTIGLAQPGAGIAGVLAVWSSSGARVRVETRAPPTENAASGAIDISLSPGATVPTIRAVPLPPGAALGTTITAQVQPSHEEIEEFERELSRLRYLTAPRIFVAASGQEPVLLNPRAAAGDDVPRVYVTYGTRDGFTVRFLGMPITVPELLWQFSVPFTWRPTPLGGPGTPLLPIRTGLHHRPPLASGSARLRGPVYAQNTLRAVLLVGGVVVFCEPAALVEGPPDFDLGIDDFDLLFEKDRAAAKSWFHEAIAGKDMVISLPGSVRTTSGRGGLDHGALRELADEVVRFVADMDIGERQGGAVVALQLAVRAIERAHGARAGTAHGGSVWRRLQSVVQGTASRGLAVPFWAWRLVWKKFTEATRAPCFPALTADGRVSEAASAIVARLALEGGAIDGDDAEGTRFTVLRDADLQAPTSGGTILAANGTPFPSGVLWVGSDHGGYSKGFAGVTGALLWPHSQPTMGLIAYLDPFGTKELLAGEGGGLPFKQIGAAPPEATRRFAWSVFRRTKLAALAGASGRDVPLWVDLGQFKLCAVTDETAPQAGSSAHSAALAEFMRVAADTDTPLLFPEQWTPCALGTVRFSVTGTPLRDMSTDSLPRFSGLGFALQAITLLTCAYLFTNQLGLEDSTENFKQRADLVLVELANVIVRAGVPAERLLGLVAQAAARLAFPVANDVAKYILPGDLPQATARSFARLGDAATTRELVVEWLLGDAVTANLLGLVQTRLLELLLPGETAKRKPSVSTHRQPSGTSLGAVLRTVLLEGQQAADRLLSPNARATQGRVPRVPLPAGVRRIIAARSGTSPAASVLIELWKNARAQPSRASVSVVIDPLIASLVPREAELGNVFSRLTVTNGVGLACPATLHGALVRMVVPFLSAVPSLTKGIARGVGFFAALRHPFTAVEVRIGSRVVLLEPRRSRDGAALVDADITVSSRDDGSLSTMVSVQCLSADYPEATAEWQTQSETLLSLLVPHGDSFQLNGEAVPGRARTPVGKSSELSLFFVPGECESWVVDADTSEPVCPLSWFVRDAVARGQLPAWVLDATAHGLLVSANAAAERTETRPGARTAALPTLNLPHMLRVRADVSSATVIRARAASDAAFSGPIQAGVRLGPGPGAKEVQLSTAGLGPSVLHYLISVRLFTFVRKHRPELAAQYIPGVLWSGTLTHQHRGANPRVMSRAHAMPSGASLLHPDPNSYGDAAEFWMSFPLLFGHRGTAGGELRVQTVRDELVQLEDAGTDAVEQAASEILFVSMSAENDPGIEEAIRGARRMLLIWHARRTAERAVAASLARRARIEVKTLIGNMEGVANNADGPHVPALAALSARGANSVVWVPRENDTDSAASPVAVRVELPDEPSFAAVAVLPLAVGDRFPNSIPTAVLTGPDLVTNQGLSPTALAWLALGHEWDFTPEAAVAAGTRDAGRPELVVATKNYVAPAAGGAKMRIQRRLMKALQWGPLADATRFVPR